MKHHLPWRERNEQNRAPATAEHLSAGVVRSLRKNLLGDASEESLKLKAGNARLHFDMALTEFRSNCALAGASSETTESRIEVGKTFLNKGFELCESPLERMILPWLIFGFYYPLAPCPVPVHNPKTDNLAPRSELFIVPQFAFAKFRTDFAVFYRGAAGVSIIAVECDGEEYHQDKRKDFDREQYLKSFGIHVVRATGNEVCTEPKSIFSRVRRQLFEAGAQ